MPKSKKRAKVQLRKAEAARVAHEQAEAKKSTSGQYARRRAFGWTLGVLAVVMLVTHLMAHVGFLYEASGLTDLTIGYPTAAVLGVAAAIVLSN